MNKQQKSFVVWLFVAVTIVSAVVVFVFSLPDFDMAETVNYEKQNSTVITTTNQTVATTTAVSTTTTVKTTTTKPKTTKPKAKTTIKSTTKSSKVTTSKTTTAKTELQVQFPLNINTATMEELMSIPGIGEVFATRIIAYREENSGFSAIEELTEIKGVGEKRLEAWREYLFCE